MILTKEPNTTTNQTKEEILLEAETLTDDLAIILKEPVSDIENSPSITQNHYGAYGSLITQLCEGKQKSYKNLIAIALIKAGANKIGIGDAMKFLIGD